MNLVVGSGGFLGRRFAESLRHRQGGVIAASHQEKSDLHLDLREDPKNLDIPRGIRYALMLSSVTSVDDCFNEPERTHTLNVVNTIKLATRFQECGVVPVFFSSDLVFRGDKGNYIEEDDTEPLTEYGKQKKIVEDMLVAEIPESIIIRLGKVYTLEDDDTSPVHGLIESLSCGKRVRAATDQVLTPTLAGEIVDSVIDLMSRGARGIYHLSPGRQGMVSRYEMAKYIADAVGADSGLIEACSIDDFSFSEPRPKNCSLNGEKFLKTTNIRLTPFAEVIGQL